LEPRRDGEEDWGLLLYERGRGDVWREVEEVLRVRVRGIRRVGPTPREAKKSKRASKGAKNSYIRKAREHFGNRTFSEEELYRFLAEEGHSDPDDLISVWKSRKKLVSAGNGRLYLKK
jgi:hypothetical protein